MRRWADNVQREEEPVIAQPEGVGNVDEDVCPAARLHKGTGVELTRKRKCDASTRKNNVHKSLRQSGKAYIKSKGKQQPKRALETKKDRSKCKFHSSLNFSENDRCDYIFGELWTLGDNEKMHFMPKPPYQQRQRKAQCLAARKTALAIAFPVMVRQLMSARFFT